MSTAHPAQNRYKADLREMRFLLFEQFKLGEVLGQAPYEAWGQDEVSMVLDEAYKFVCEVLGPLNAGGDREGCRLEGGSVKTPTGFKGAWDKIYEAGWKVLGVSPEHDGQGAPAALTILVEEMPVPGSALCIFSEPVNGTIMSVMRGGQHPDEGAS